MIHHLLAHLCSYLEDNIEDCSFFVDYLPGKDFVVQNTGEGVYITLLSITEDVAAKIPFVYKQDANRNISKQDPQMILELSVMVSAYFKTYTESLKAISKVIQKLADKKNFITEDFTYSLAMYNMTMDQSNNLWQALSTDVLPNVIYKIRHVNMTPDSDEK